MTFDMRHLDEAIAAANWPAAATLARNGWNAGLRNADFLAKAGKALYYGGDYNLAAHALNTLIQLVPTHAEGFNQLGIIMVMAHRWQDGIKLLERALTLNPNDAIAAYNLAVCHQQLGETSPRIARLLEHAIAQKPDWPAPLLKLAMHYSTTKDFPRALELFQRLMKLTPNEWQAYFGMGIILQELKNVALARDFYATAAELAPNAMPPLFQLLRLMVRECDVEAYAPLLPKFTALLEQGQAGASVMMTCMVEERADLQLKAAQLLAVSNVEPACSATPLTTLGTPMRGPNIRLGFLTDDLREHPVGHLMTVLFEQLDRSRFDTVVFGYGEPDDAVTLRCKAAATEWHDVSKLGQRATAEAIAAAGIDIMIDLKGHTRHARTSVYGYRPAPVSVNFLGYPATMGHRAWDYIVADPFIVPHGYEHFYSEKILRLPGCYQPNDPKRPLPTPLSRADYGLPEDAVVLASFNQPQKLSIPLLNAWMSILNKAPNTVLWLREFDNWPTAKTNLLALAQRNGVDAARIIFAPHAKSHSDHLARYGTVDLALDTYPYNSQTTASDVLWMGCPLLSKPGQAFASRVAGSLINATGLTELLADDWDTYVARALELISRPDRLAALRNHLVQGRHGFSMFDTPSYLAGFEHAMEMIHQRRLAGLSPDHVQVELPQLKAAA